jgi:arsenical pump membrane protein
VCERKPALGGDSLLAQYELWVLHERPARLAQGMPTSSPEMKCLGMRRRSREVRPHARRHWLALPALVAVLGFASGAFDGREALAVRTLVDPLAFLAGAVPFAVLLQRSGFFEGLAARMAFRRHCFGELWALAVLTTAVFNLDVAVVVLTPLYVRLGRYRGNPLAVAAMPAVAALVGSSFLPVSNLTNLIAVGRFGLATSGFLRVLGLPSVAAVATAGWSLRRRAGQPPSSPQQLPAGEERVGLVGVILALVAASVIGAPLLGVPAWHVVGLGAVALAAHQRFVPWRAVPVELVGFVAGLGVLTTAAVHASGFAPFAVGSSPVRATVVATGAGVVANLRNNLPAFLAAVSTFALVTAAGGCCGRRSVGAALNRAGDG